LVGLRDRNHQTGVALVLEGWFHVSSTTAPRS
jgi:hypothetical protein